MIFSVNGTAEMRVMTVLRNEGADIKQWIKKSEKLS